MGAEGRPWLTAQGHQHVRDELERLLLTHRLGMSTHEGHTDAEAWARHHWRESRIRHLQELLLTATVGAARPDDGVAEAGMVLTVRIDDAPHTETFLLAESDVVTSSEVDVYSPASPIGRALLGAREGDTRTCQLPDGHTISITLLTAKPYDYDNTAREGAGRAESGERHARYSAMPTRRH
jgi:transcription elongation factor GreA